MDIINLSDGIKVPNQLCLVRCLCINTRPGMSGTVTHEAGGVISSKPHPVGEGGFTALVQLQPGNNHIVAHYGTHSSTRKLIYEPPTSDKFVRLIYVTCLDEEKFQGPKDMDRSANAAVKHIQAGVLAMQSFVAENFHELGFERKTFKLEHTTQHLPKVHVLQLPMSIQEVHSQSEEKLWEIVAMQVLSSHLADNNCKYIAFLGATRYTNVTGETVSCEASVVSQTKGHVSLGGGGLALVGTGALYAWPRDVESVIDAFRNTTAVDSRSLMDFSSGRSTWGACFGTHLGSVLHELGHTFDLGHTKHGIMARGFEDLHLFFTSPLVHCSFAKHALKSGSVRATLSSSSLVKEPMTFRTDFVVRRNQTSNVNMTVAPLHQEYDTMSTDTSSSDATSDSDGTLRSVPQYKCSLHCERHATSTPPASTHLSSDNSPEDNNSSPAHTNASTENLCPGTGFCSNNLTTSLVDLGNSTFSSESSSCKAMTTSFSSLEQNSGHMLGSKSQTSMPDLRCGSGLRNNGRMLASSAACSKLSVGCRAYWSRVNAVMLATHKWLNDYGEGSSQKPQLKGSVVCASGGVRLVELRDLNTLSFHHWEWMGRAPPLLHIPWAQVHKWPAHTHIQLLAMDVHGNLLKDCFVPRPL